MLNVKHPLGSSAFDIKSCLYWTTTVTKDFYTPDLEYIMHSSLERNETPLVRAVTQGPVGTA